ncbi:hypothetical protein L7F22_067655 [Adiantum nelumboides]|nr:hypothetical protein [Adiantum nelumboides]
MSALIPLHSFESPLLLALLCTTCWIALFVFLAKPTKSKPQVYIVDYSCAKCLEDTEASLETLFYFIKSSGSVSVKELLFQSKVFLKSAIGEEAYGVQFNLSWIGSMGRSAGLISLGLARDLLGVNCDTTRYVLVASSEIPQQIDILVVNGSLLNPTPSVSALLVNHFKMRFDVKAFHLAGMGCSAGLISFGLVRDLLQVHRGTTRYALGASTESGIREEVYVPRANLAKGCHPSIEDFYNQAQFLVVGAANMVLKKTGISPQQIDILAVNCGFFNPSSSLSALLVNHYKVRFDVKAFHLAGEANDGDKLPLSQLFQSKVFLKSGINEEAYVPRANLAKGCHVLMEDTYNQAQILVVDATDVVLKKTGISPEQIGILVVSCGLFNPTLSLSAFLVNQFKMRSDVKAFHLGGMGCSAGLISLGLAMDLPQVHRVTTRYALVASSEVIQALYHGKGRPMMVTYCLFRSTGNALVLLNRREDKQRAKFQVMHVTAQHEAKVKQLELELAKAKADLEAMGSLASTSQIQAKIHLPIQPPQMPEMPKFQGTEEEEQLRLAPGALDIRE